MRLLNYPNQNKQIWDLKVEDFPDAYIKKLKPYLKHKYDSQDSNTGNIDDFENSWIELIIMPFKVLLRRLRRTSFNILFFHLSRPLRRRAPRSCASRSSINLVLN